VSGIKFPANKQNVLRYANCISDHVAALARYVPDTIAFVPGDIFDGPSRHITALLDRPRIRAESRPFLSKSRKHCRSLVGGHASLLATLKIWLQLPFSKMIEPTLYLALQLYALLATIGLGADSSILTSLLMNISHTTRVNNIVPTAKGT